MFHIFRTLFGGIMIWLQKYKYININNYFNLINKVSDPKEISKFGLKFQYKWQWCIIRVVWKLLKSSLLHNCVTYMLGMVRSVTVPGVLQCSTINWDLWCSNCAITLDAFKTIIYIIKINIQMIIEGIHMDSLASSLVCLQILADFIFSNKHFKKNKL